MAANIGGGSSSAGAPGADPDVEGTEDVGGGVPKLPSAQGQREQQHREEEEEEDDEEIDAKKTAMRDIPTPTGYRRCVVPPASRNRSSAYDHGVRFEQDRDLPDPKQQRWLCACNEACRTLSMKGKGVLTCTQGGTGNVTRHLRIVHSKIISTRQKRATKTKKAVVAVSVNRKKATVTPGSDPGRAMLLLYVKVFVIGHLLPFSLSDSPDVRTFFQVCCNDAFPRARLNSKMIKHCVAELYNATVSKLSRSLRDAVAGAGCPVLHASFDLWTSKMSNENFIGLRLHWCTPNFELDSALVAVKFFQPSADLITQGAQLSNVLAIWVEEVMGEFALDMKDLFCTVTDAGSDVNRLNLKVSTSEWEWCFRQMLSCVLVEAFGTTASRAACKNPDARKIIDAVENVVEHLSRRNVMKHLRYARATKLANTVPNRWISTCNVLEEVLRSWGALEEHYRKNERGGRTFPLAAHKTQIEELYGLMKPVSVAMKDSQETGVPTGLTAFIAVVMLRCTTLDTAKPLDVTVPRKAAAGGGAGGTAATATVARPAASLQDVTTSARKLLRDGLDERFFMKRYRCREKAAASQSPALVFEMAACMSPSFHTLPWLPVLCTTEKAAKRVHERIKDKVLRLMVAMAKGAGTASARGSPEKGGDGDGSTPGALPLKRQGGPFSGAAPSKRKHTEMTKRLVASGIFRSGSSNPDEAGGNGPTERTLEDVCEHELERFEKRFGDAGVADYPMEYLLRFWADEGEALYPNMARAARVLLSVPGSSAVLEGDDFGAAGRRRLVDGAPSRPGGGYADMVLFLNGNKDRMPKEVAALSGQEGLDAVPERLSNPSEAAESLSVGEVAQDDSGDDHVE